MKRQLCSYCGENHLLSFGNLVRHEKACANVVGIDLQKEYDSKLSVNQVCAKFGITPKFLKARIKTRSRSEGTRIAFENGSNPVFHKGYVSRGEKVFAECVRNSNILLNDEVVREFKVASYRIDFAFPSVKLAVEIDGAQHHVYQTQIEHDKTRDEFLMKLGWTVYRIESKDFLSRQGYIFDKFLDYYRTLTPETPRERVVYSGQIVDGQDLFRKERIEKIMDSGVDFSSRGWGKNLSLVLNIPSTSARIWVKRNLPEIFKTAWMKSKTRETAY